MSTFVHRHRSLVSTHAGRRNPNISTTRPPFCSSTLGYDVVAESTPTGNTGSGELCPSNAWWYEGHPVILRCRQVTTADICDQQRRPKRLAQVLPPIQGVREEGKVSSDLHLCRGQWNSHDADFHRHAAEGINIGPTSSQTG